MNRNVFLVVLFFLGISLIGSADTFSDIPEGHWAFKATRELSSRGILIGFPDGSFKGDKGVNRYHLAAVLSRMLTQMGSMIQASQAQGTINYQTAMNLLSERSLISRYPIRSGKNKSRLTRFELVMTLYEFFESVRYSAEYGQSNPAGTENFNQVAGTPANSNFERADSVQFSDVKPEHWAYNDVSKVASLGIMGAYSKSSFKGAKTVSKYQFLAAMEKLRQQVLPMFEGKGVQTASANVENPQENSFGRPTVSDREIIRLPAKVSKASTHKRKHSRTKVAKSQPKEKVEQAPIKKVEKAPVQEVVKTPAPEVKNEEPVQVVEQPAPVEDQNKKTETVVVTAADSNNSTEVQKPVTRPNPPKRDGDDKNYFRRGFN